MEKTIARIAVSAANYQIDRPYSYLVPDELANAVQTALNQTVNAGNEKTEKAIDASIFLMKNVTAPAILIECGFLSNENETALLKSGEYQQRLAVVIASGLLQQ